LKRKKSAGEYLAFLCAKHDVDSDRLFFALLSAGENGKAKCGELSIECRDKKKGRIIFLITKDSEVVAQLAASEEFLTRKGNPINDYMETDMVRKQIAKRTKSPTSCTIGDLKVGMNHISLEAKVVEVTKPRVVSTRYGNYASLAKAVIEDNTGQIKLCLWNNQIDAVSAGATVQIKNARTSTFKGERQLSLGKTGTVNNIENLDDIMPTDLQQQTRNN
jgi:replication factor A1